MQGTDTMGELSNHSAFGHKLLKDFMFADDYLNLNQGRHIGTHLAQTGGSPTTTPPRC